MEFEIQQVLTHAVGFLITVWILKRYAWKPLLSLMDERREKIAGEFEKIEVGKADVARLNEDYQAKLRNIEDERREKLLQAVEEGKDMAAEIKAQALEETKQARAKAKADLEREVSKAKVQLRDELVSMTVTATEKILRERVDEAKHRELIGRFIDQLEKA
jgi:F-type H+-transporting ATPase subunit b